MSKTFNDGADNHGTNMDYSAQPTNGAPAARRHKPLVQKVTLYVRPEQIIQIEEIQLQEHRRTRTRPDKSELVQEALDLLIQKYNRVT
jgi:hypothetical protein